MAIWYDFRMLRSLAPASFILSYLAGILAQLTSVSSTEQLTLYTVVGGGIIAGFTAVWVKIWQMHSDWKTDKNATINALREDVNRAREDLSKARETITELREEIATLKAELAHYREATHE